MRIAVPRLHQNRKSQAYGFSCEAGAAAPRVPWPNDTAGSRLDA